MTPSDFLEAARVPHSIQPQTFGFWTISRHKATDPGVAAAMFSIGQTIGWPDYTILRRFTDASLHTESGEVVMEDSLHELRRHLPIWMAARGRVLKTGLGLGCVVRGLLANPEVEHVDVVEIDAGIIRVVGEHLAGNPRITIHHADARHWDFGERRWDFAWHDLHSFDDTALAWMHAELMWRYEDAVGEKQGAWAFPREVARRWPYRPLGAPRARRLA